MVSWWLPWQIVGDAWCREMPFHCGKCLCGVGFRRVLLPTEMDSLSDGADNRTWKADFSWPFFLENPFSLGYWAFLLPPFSMLQIASRSLKVSMKVRAFTWTTESSRSSPQSRYCVLCHSSGETASHLFLHSLMLEGPCFWCKGWIYGFTTRDFEFLQMCFWRFGCLES